MTLSDAYLAKVARSHRIPEMWVEDYCQEVRLKLWQHPEQEPGKSTAKSLAIDYARKFGPYGRNRADHTYAYLDTAWQATVSDFSSISDWKLDTLRMIGQLSPYMLRGLVAAINGTGDGNNRLQQGASHARKRMRELSEV